MRRLPYPGGSTSDSGVGHFRVPIQIGRRGGERFAQVDALVDTGSTYSWIPRDLLHELGITPEREWPFELADGREVRYPVGWIQIRLEGVEQPTLVVFAPAGTEPILGAFTLEGFLLAADPVNERLISVPGLAKLATVS
jgi:clan AA aspartic protease